MASGSGEVTFFCPYQIVDARALGSDPSFRAHELDGLQQRCVRLVRTMT